jgi:hypothetical protein
MVASGAAAGFGVDDSAALHFTGTELIEVVSSRPDVAAYRVEFRDGGIVETRLPARFLGA